MRPEPPLNTISRTRRTVPRSVAALVAAGLILAGCGSGGEDPGRSSLSLRSFTTPAGNIGCIAVAGNLRCDIARHTWRVKPNPDCPVDWGNGLSVGKHGRGRVVCAGDTVMNDGPALGPGNVNLAGPFECESGEAGDSMRCENVRTGHGFELSPGSWRTY